MPRYIVERSFPDCLEIPQDEAGRATVRRIVANNTSELVTWIHSFVTMDKTKSFCIYDGPTPESIRSAASVNGLPIDLITEVSVLDPYFYLGET
jgi:hypothetical protein